MTLRSFIIGLMVAAFICGVTYFNDAVLGQNFLIGNFLPVVVFGPAILFLVFLNPLLSRAGKRWALSGAELAVILMMGLCACAIPGTNLMRKFTNLLMLPHHLNRTEAGWQEGAVLDRVPDIMMADPSAAPEGALDGFVQGLSGGGQHISFMNIPWEAWSGTLTFWIPLILILWVGMMGLGLVLHRQWSEHEKLPYPVVRFLDQFMNGDASGKSLMRNQRFMIAAGLVLLVHLSNYLYAWNPNWIEIPLNFDFSALLDKYPVLSEANGQASHLANPHVYFSVMAIAFFLSREVSLSMGLGPFLFATVMTILLLSGVPMQGSGIKSNMFAPGAGFGLVAVVIFTGWYHYLSVFKSALRLPVRAKVFSSERWGMRIFFISQILFVLILSQLHIDWRIALLFSICLVATFVILSRTLAETGLFYMQTQWAPTVLILALLGAKTVGPEQVAVLLFLGLVLQASPRATLLPFFMSGLKLLEFRKVGAGRGATAALSAILIGLLVAVPVTLYFQYDSGVNARDLWAVEGVPRAPFQLSLQVETQLESSGELATTRGLEGWERWRQFEPNRTSVITFCLGLGIFLAVSGIRLRFAGWPLHPILFLFWNSPHLTMFAASFLLGWGLKFIITRYGGEQVYSRFKPVMLGLFAGEMLGALIPILIGWVYYLVSGGVPPSFTVLPYF